MKILIVSYMIPEAPSGVSVHYMNLAKSLERAGHQVQTLSVADAQQIIRKTSTAASKILSLFGGLGKELARESQNFIRIYTAVRQMIRKKDFDIINAQDLGSAYAAKLASNGRIPVLLTCHFNDDPATETIKRRNLTGLAVTFTKKWHQHLFKAITYYNGVSSYVIKRSRHLFNTEAIVEVIHNGVDFKAVQRTSPLSVLQSQYPGKYVLMNIGHLEKRKNQELFLEAAYYLKKQRSDFVCAIVGNGEDYAYLQEQIQKRDLADCVGMLGHHDDVIPVLKSADIYMHTALNENCPLVLLEAIASGVPVFALAVGGIPELVKQKEALFSPGITAEFLADKLSAALNNEQFRAKLQHLQYEDGLKGFDIYRMTHKYLMYYQRIIRHFEEQKISGNATLKTTDANEISTHKPVPNN